MTTEALTTLSERWSARATRTAPADRDAAEQGIRTIYRATGRPEPRAVVWASSPRAATIVASLLETASARGWDWIGARVHDRELIRVFKPLDQRFLDQVTDRVGPGAVQDLHHSMSFRHLPRPDRDAVYTWTPDSTGRTDVPRPTPAEAAAVWNAAVAQLPAEFRRTDPFGGSPSPADTGDGGHLSALDLGYADLFQQLAHLGDHHGIPWPDRLGAVLTAAGEAVRWVPFEGVALVVDRPAEVHTDDLGRLHRTDGPARRSRDGHEEWALHGTPVPPGPDAWTDCLSPDAVPDGPDPRTRERALLDLYAHRLVVCAALRWNPYTTDATRVGSPHRGHTLHDLPDHLLGGPARVLAGARHAVVPACLPDAAAALAWLDEDDDTAPALLDLVRERAADRPIDIHDFYPAYPDPVEEIELPGGARLEPIAGSDSGGAYFLCGSGPLRPLMYADSEGGAAVLGRDLTEAVELLIGLPYWQNLATSLRLGELGESARRADEEYTENEPQEAAERGALAAAYGVRLRGPEELAERLIRTDRDLIAALRPIHTTASLRSVPYTSLLRR